MTSQRTKALGARNTRRGPGGSPSAGSWARVGCFIIGAFVPVGGSPKAVSVTATSALKMETVAGVEVWLHPANRGAFRSLLEVRTRRSGAGPTAAAFQMWTSWSYR